MKQSKEKCHGWAMNGLGKRCGRTAQTSEVWKGCPLFSSPVSLFIEKAAGGGGWGGGGGAGALTCGILMGWSRLISTLYE